jgi:putative endonuclease
MFYIYAISSLKRNWIYVGMTIDLKARIERHNDGRERTTKGYRPFELIYTETVETRLEARAREKYWKSGVGKEQLRLIRDNKIVPK